MRLNGIQAEPGTVIGVHYRNKNFLTVVGEDDGGVVVRHSTEDEVRPQSFKHEPRSVTEHHGIKRRMSPYGLIRQFKPTPVKAVKLEIELPTGRQLSRVDRRALMRRMRKNMLR